MYVSGYYIDSCEEGKGRTEREAGREKEGRKEGREVGREEGRKRGKW